ncbi:MAG: hypothetical protein IPL32_09840 [Chloracidobacterium sp.]|nr:hypothetical protein [Chloracidobacterium sp.]
MQNAHAQVKPTQPNSAQSSPKLGIRANEITPEAEPPVVLGRATERQSLSAHRAAKPQETTPKGVTLNACIAAVDELKASRVLIDALEGENRALDERLETEKQAIAILKELNETRRSESEALRATVAAKNETIAAKDKVIDSQDKLVTALKGKKRSPLGRIGDILIGAAIFAVLK